jgi:mevalonate kinase
MVAFIQSVEGEKVLRISHVGYLNPLQTLLFMIKASAPGKVHLIGEHAVVYGEPSIIAAIGKRIWVEAKSQEEKVTVKDRGMSQAAEWMVNDCIDSAMQAQAMWMKGFEEKDFSSLFRFVRDGQNFKKIAIGLIFHRLNLSGGVDVNIYGDVPLGSGLGSSSALAVALTRAISGLHGKELSREEINRIAFDIEKMVHGTPSGGDNTASTFGGLVWFQKNDTGKPTIESLKEEVTYELENFVLAYIKKPVKTTGELVQMVRNLEPSFRDTRIKEIGNAAIAMRSALRQKDLSRAKELINLAWRNLSELGLSIPEADGLISRIRGMGGAAKLCGACGGGIMLAYHEDKEALKKLIREAGYSPWETELGAEGSRLE